RALRAGAHRPEVGKLAFEALDLEPQGRPAREGERHHPAGGIVLGEFDGQQVEDGILASRIHVPALAGQYPLEPQCRAAAAQLRTVAGWGTPVEPVDR